MKVSIKEHAEECKHYMELETSKSLINHEINKKLYLKYYIQKKALEKKIDINLYGINSNTDNISIRVYSDISGNPIQTIKNLLLEIKITYQIL